MMTPNPPNPPGAPEADEAPASFIDEISNILRRPKAAVRGTLRAVDVNGDSDRQRKAIVDYATGAKKNADPLPTIFELSDLAGTWLSMLSWGKRTPKGGDAFFMPHSTVSNLNTILRHDGRWRGVLAYDEFAERVTTTSLPPWHPTDGGGAVHGDWVEEDTARLESWLHRTYGIKLSDSKIYASVAVVSRAHSVHPVRTYLRGLEWDGAERISTWLTTLLGVADSPYARAVGRLWLISAVARVMRPGCKVDTMLVLEGKTGIRKSSALRALAGDEWFTEISAEIDPRETPQLLRRKWIAEMGELAALRRTRDQETIKSFLSRQCDNYRPPYGKCARDFARQSVFAGSTNEDRYLKDPTGQRRFLPIRCGKIDLQGIEIERDQLWAEAVVAFDAGEQWYLTDDALIAASIREQGERFEDDVWTEPVEDYCRPRVQVGVSTHELLGSCLGIEMGKWTHAELMRVGSILRRIGWGPVGSERPRRYRPVGAT